MGKPQKSENCIYKSCTSEKSYCPISERHLKKSLQEYHINKLIPALRQGQMNHNYLVIS